MTVQEVEIWSIVKIKETGEKGTVEGLTYKDDVVLSLLINRQGRIPEEFLPSEVEIIDKGFYAYAKKQRK